MCPLPFYKEEIMPTSKHPHLRGGKESIKDNYHKCDKDNNRGSVQEQRK